MPRYVRPLLPADVESITDALGANRARVAVLLDLLDHPEASRAEISQRTGVPANAAFHHLQQLQSSGLVRISNDPSGRRGARYLADRHALLTSLEVLRKRLDET